MGSSMPLVGHSLAIFICAAVMMSVSIMAVALRTFVRIYTVRAFGWDDALMVIALVGSLIFPQARQRLIFN